MTSPRFFEVSILFRKMLEDAGPASMEDALDCLHGMVNTAAVRLHELGGQSKSEGLLHSAWNNIYDASKGIEP